MGGLWLLVVVMVGSVGGAGRVVVAGGGCREYGDGWAIAG